MPASVTDDMLLVEAVRSWYGVRDPMADPPPGLRRLLDYVRSSPEPLGDGPVLPLSAATWTKLLQCAAPCNLALALVSNRDAMLMYHGLMAMDNETQQWIAGHPSLLADLLEKGAPALAFAGPSLQLRKGVLSVPGGDAMREAWGRVAGERLTNTEAFVRELLRRDNGRLAWLFSALSNLDSSHLSFAVAGGEESLRPLARYARNSSPEWVVAERPFWRPYFDVTLVLALADLGPRGVLKGSDAFWKEVFRSDDLESWRENAGQPLTAASLIDLVFDQPFTARDRWEVFSLGQRLPGVETNSPEAGRVLRGARRHPVLAQMLDRIGVTSAPLLAKLHQASARVTDSDPEGARGELGAWQGALAVIERSTLTGGLDRAAAEVALTELGALALSNPRAELTAWLLGSFLPRLAARPGAPADAERMLFQAMAGQLTPAGQRREFTFTWEDLPYAFAAPRSLVGRMGEARAAQDSATLEDARVAWKIAAGDVSAADTLVSRLRDVGTPGSSADLARRLDGARKDRDTEALRKEARRSAEAIVTALLPALAYAPHLAVTETPALGADVAFRHEFVAPEEGAGLRRMHPWQIARGQARADAGWHLEGSLLMLDLGLANWYLRHSGEPPSSAPVFDEKDDTALAQVAAIARSGGFNPIALEEAAQAVDRGRHAAAASLSLDALDWSLAQAGVDPWRRKALALRAASPAELAGLLTDAEAWRLAGAPGRLAASPAFDGSARFVTVPHSTLLMEGRRSAGVVGASSVDAQLRVAAFMRQRHLPAELFGDLAAGVLAEVIETTQALRPDDVNAIAMTVSRIDDTRMEEYLLALVGDGTLARPSERPN
jgi:hypothetical protein